MLRLLAPATILVLFATPALAQVPAGGEFQVNTYTTGPQSAPGIAGHDRYGFVIAWHGDGPGGIASVFGRRFDEAGAPLGPEFVVPQTLTGGIPRMAFSRAGDFMVLWERSPSQLFGRRFDRAGTGLGAQFAVNNDTFYVEGRPAIAALNPGFVVVWTSFRGDAPPLPAQVLGQLFDASGGRVGAQFRVDVPAGFPSSPSVVADEAGNFVVVWQSSELRARRFDRQGVAQGAEFAVNTYTTGTQNGPSAAASADGSFVVAWNSQGQVTARRFDAAGTPLGPEFLVSTSTVYDGYTSVASDSAGNFAVVWAHSDGSGPGMWARRFAADGTSRGGEFRVNSYTTGKQRTFFLQRSVAADGAGNLAIVWNSDLQDGSSGGVFGQRYGGLLPASLSVADGDNAVLEVGDTFTAAIAWRNVNGAAQTFQGHLSDISEPSAGLLLQLFPDANYGTVASGAVGPCVGPCFSGTLSGSRPPGHVDARFLETIVPDVLGQVKRWTLHVGESFTDVTRSNLFYRYVETLLHRGVTAGCGLSVYCPAASTTREQMTVFLLRAKEASTYAPPACASPVFADVPASSPFCPWIEELARRGVTAGCGGGNFCPTAEVSREQMAVFLLRTLDPALNPPACTTPVFGDVPASSPFCRWIEELARRGVVSGCGGGNYCPTAPVTREQMAVFLTGTFGLTLYGP